MALKLNSASGSITISAEDGSGNVNIEIPRSGFAASDPQLTDLAGLTPTDGNFIVGDGSNFVTESGDTAIASLGITATASELNALDGITATVTELNTLDGITATTAELNLLDGVTATTSEINYLDGVTSNIQTQLDSLQDLDADLTAIAALSSADGNFIVGSATGWVVESGAAARTSLGLTIGTDVQAYDADTAKYDDVTANFTGTLQNGGSNVLVDSDIGSTVQAYDSNLQSFVTTFTVPTADGTSGQVLITDGAGTISFGNVEALPSQTGNSGYYLTTDGTTASWDEIFYDVAAVQFTGTTPTIDTGTGNYFYGTLSGATTFTFSNAPASGVARGFILEIKQDASGSGYGITWPASVAWRSGSAFSPSTAADAVDIIVFTTRDGGTTWLGSVAGKGYA